MIVKEKFVLIKDGLNLLNLKKSDILKYQVKNGKEIARNTIMMMEHGIRHMSKPSVFSLFKKKDSFDVLYLPNYPFYYSYNKPTNQLIINLFPFGVEAITPTRPNPMNIYGCLAASLCLANLVNGKVNIKTHYMEPIISFFSSMLIQMLGRHYGITEKYSNEIPKLKFLIAMYIYVAFAGVDKESAKKLSRTISAFNYDEYEEQLNDFTFEDVGSFIQSLSKLGAMPGITNFYFLDVTYKYLGSNINAIPMFEDFSRCISVILASNIEGSTIQPTFLKKYNNEEFFRIITIAKLALAG